MTLPRYQTPDLPMRGAGAFLPNPLVQPALLSSQGLQYVFASWGTTPVPAPKPSTTASGVRTSADGKAMGSNVTPDAILPALAIADTANMGPWKGAGGFQWPCTNDVPVPAVNVVRSAAVAQNAPTKFGGRRITPWPRVFPRWPSVAQPNESHRPLW